MKIGIPIMGGRVSPVFDVAQRLLLVTCDRGQVVERTACRLEDQELTARARRVAQCGLDVLICGAISRPLEALVIASGVELLPQTCGPVEDVLEAFLAGRLTERDFLIPGCPGRRRRCRHRGHQPRDQRGGGHRRRIRREGSG
jgi:predicted Fe-Mo cluster-binding NifX family protein